MKKTLLLTVATLFIATASFASTDEVVQGMADRAIRGSVNLVTGIVEWPMQTVKGYENGFDQIENEFGSKTVGTVLGFFRGIGHSAGRIGSGATELFGFWAVSPEDNDDVGVPLDAEYAWEEGTQYSIFEPTLSEGLQPMWNKLGRGLGNGFLGIAELPGQIRRGYQNEELLQGIGRGIWYSFSRAAYGLGEAFVFWGPNPPDNPGVSFPDQWPWDALAE